MSRPIRTGSFRRSRAAPAGAPRFCRLTLETLEARITPQAVTTIVVNLSPPGTFSTTYSSAAQVLPGVTALIAVQGPPLVTVNEGLVTFTVQDSHHVPLEDSHGKFITASAPVLAGAATASFPLPAGLPVGVYSIDASYSDVGGVFKDALAGDLPAVLTVTPATPTVPTVTVTDAGGDNQGDPYPATATVNGGASLEGVAPLLTYYLGDFTLAQLTGLTPPTPLTGSQDGAANGVPVAVGRYTVLASFPGSPDYASTSAATSFFIAPRPPTISISANPLSVDNDDFFTSSNTITLSQTNDPYPNALVTVTATDPDNNRTTLQATVFNGAWSVRFPSPLKGLYTFKAAQMVDGLPSGNSAAVSIQVVNPPSLPSSPVAADKTIVIDPGSASPNLSGTDANSDSVALVLAFQELPRTTNSVILLVYSSEPGFVAANAQPTDADGLFFDVRMTNPAAVSSSSPVTLTLQSSQFSGLTLSQASADLHFFDPNTGLETPLTGPNFQIVALQGDTITIDVLRPGILTKTVFAISLLSSTSTTTANIRPAQAAAAPAATGTSTTVTFASAAQVAGFLTASGDSVAVSGAAQGSLSTTGGASFTVTGALAGALASTASGGDDGGNDAAVDALWQWLLQDGGLLKLWLGRGEQEPLWMAASAPAPAANAAAGVLLERVSAPWPPAEADADLVGSDRGMPGRPAAPAFLDVFTRAAWTAADEVNWAALAAFAALQAPDCQGQRRERATGGPGFRRDHREGWKVQ